MAFESRPIITLVSELKTSSEILLGYLSSVGLDGDVVGEGLGAAVSTEEAYKALLNAFAGAPVHEAASESAQPKERSRHNRRADSEDNINNRKGAPTWSETALSEPAHSVNRTPSPAHVADSVDLFGRGRSLEDATIKSGYGFLIEDRKPYTKPCTVRVDQRILPGHELIEAICNENQQFRQRIKID